MHCIFPAVRTAFVFLPVLTSLYGRFKGRAEGGAHFFVWHLIEGRLFFRMCFLNMRFVFDFNFFYELYVFYLLFYRLNFMILHRELHHVRFFLLFFSNMCVLM